MGIEQRVEIKTMQEESRDLWFKQGKEELQK